MYLVTPHRFQTIQTYCLVLFRIGGRGQKKHLFATQEQLARHERY